MLWFLTAHIIAFLFWGAALLYLPALIAIGRRQAALNLPGDQRSMARFVYTHIASPAAMAAIAAGTAVFLIEHIVTFWMLVKLVLVTGLAVVHGVTGIFIWWLEDHPDKPALVWCWVLGLVALALMTAIIWLVLAKPEPVFFP